MPDQVDWRAFEREATPGRAVGRLLRDQREALGLSVSDIKTRLRIRGDYVEAIEQGRFDLLPGAAYIPAFLRAYASNVGLDPEKILSAYQLAGPVPIKRPISLPADFPLAEKRAPVGLAVLTVLLVVGAGYAVWHYLPRQETAVSEKVPPVPDRLLAARPSTPAAATEAPASVVTAPAASLAPPEARGGQGVLPPETWPASRRDGTVASAAQPPPLVVAVPAPPPPVVMTVPTVGQAQAAQAPGDVQEARTVPEPTAAASTETLPLQTTPPLAPPARFDTPLTVRSNSWVELRSPSGDVLAMTYVRAGESYVIPAGIAFRVIDAR